jgi:putative transposase
MGIKRHKPEEIVTKLRQVEVLVGQGVARAVAQTTGCLTQLPC